MKIYFNGWYGGFFEKTNPGLHIQFFLDLFKKVYKEDCIVGTFEESTILCEFCMLINTKTKLNDKKWKNTFMMSGESYTNKYESQYDCVLWMERNHKNIINMPLHIPYIYTNNFLDKLENQEMRTSVPKGDIVVIISNPNGKTRNRFLELLEKKMNVTYAGRYKNNMGGYISSNYNTESYKNFVSQFKFIISMENTRYETGITEKIVHGMLAQTLPVYWGSPLVYEYFNKERFLNLEDDSVEGMNKIIEEMISIKNNDQKWLDMVNNNTFPQNGKLWRTIDKIAKDIRCLLNKKPFDIITKINLICNPEFELERYNMMQKLMNDLKINNDYVEYIAPTYKHTIKDDVYKYHTDPQLVLRMRRNGPKLKKSELSLTLNIKKNLENIVKNYKEGIFLLFESDVMASNDIEKFGDFLNEIKDKDWDCIHLGWSGPNLGALFTDPVIPGITGYRNFGESLPVSLINYLQQNWHRRHGQCLQCGAFYIEDNKRDNDKYRLIRKFHTRCTDSLLWTYKGIVKYLNFINKMERNLSCPADYLMIHFLENNIDFKHYWSVNEFFKQGSNLGLVKSNIQ